MRAHPGYWNDHLRVVLLDVHPGPQLIVVQPRSVFVVLGDVAAAAAAAAAGAVLPSLVTHVEGELALRPCLVFAVVDRKKPVEELFRPAKHQHMMEGVCVG